MKKFRLAVAVAASVVLIAGCGAQVEESTDAAASGYPVTVTNCGVETTFTAAPKRVVVNDINMTEMMFALGLKDQMVGYLLNSDAKEADSKASPWKDDFASSTRIGTRLNKELIMGENADLVFAGWNYGFSESSGVTPQSLADVGIDTYLLTESCRQADTKARGIMDPIEALYTDLENLGIIFGVQDRAQKLIDGYRKTIADAQATIDKDRDVPRVFLYDGGTDQPLTVGANAAGSAVIAKAGGTNIFKDLDDSWTNVSFAAVADRNPQVIIGDLTEEDKRFLESYPLMSTTTAVKERNYFRLTYPQMTEGPQNPQTIADFAAYLGSLKLAK